MMMRIERHVRHSGLTQPGVGCQHAVKADQMQARTRHQRGQALHEFQRRHDDVRGAVSVHSADTLGELAVKSGISPRLALTVGEFNPYLPKSHGRPFARKARHRFRLRWWTTDHW